MFSSPLFYHRSPPVVPPFWVTCTVAGRPDAMDVDTPAAAPAAAAAGGDEISPAPAAVAATSNAVAAPAGRKAFEVKRYAAVAMWSWDVVVQSCAICRNHIMQHCIECQANASSTTMAECNVATGMCNHGTWRGAGGGGVSAAAWRARVGTAWAAEKRWMVLWAARQACVPQGPACVGLSQPPLVSGTGSGV